MAVEGTKGPRSESALLEKSEIDCIGHGPVANIVGMEMVSRSKARRQSAGMIRISGIVVY